MSAIINPFIFGSSGPVFGVTWTGITGATESPTGRLTKTASQGWGNCGAVSVETMAGDCRFTIYVEINANRYFVGIGPDSSCDNFNTVDFAFFQDNGLYSIYESGSSPTNRSTAGGFTSTMLVIERVGTDYDYYYLDYSGSRPAPDDAGRTHWRGPITGSGSTLYVNAALFHQNPPSAAPGLIDAADIIWEAI